MAKLTLLTATGHVHLTAGLNWGSNVLNHTTPYDAYVPLHIGTIRRNNALIPPVSIRQNILTFHWDDGVVMACQFEATQTDSITGVVYPKQIASTPQKRTLGMYFRDRLGVPHSHFITMSDLLNYGRTDIDLINIGPSQYSADFHV